MSRRGDDFGDSLLLALTHFGGTEEGKKTRGPAAQVLHSLLLCARVMFYYSPIQLLLTAQ